MLDRARDAYARQRWDEAREGFEAASESDELGVDDLAAYAESTWWMGDTDGSLTLWERVFGSLLDDDRPEQAAQVAIETGFLWMIRGEPTVASGWIARAARLLGDRPECVAHGYLVYLQAQEAMATGALDAATECSRTIQAIARRHEDPTLGAIGLALEGLTLVRSGDVGVGLGAVDEAMLPVRAGEVRPNWAGNLYCNVIGLFVDLLDLERARAWTDATERWCDRSSHAVMFAGICRLHRAQLLHAGGRWSDGVVQAQRACDELADMNVAVVAEGRYLVGEMHRLRGDHQVAEACFLEAHEMGRDPQPGLARLRLAQGRPSAAAAGLDAALAETVQPLQRPALLAARAEVAVHAREIEHARLVADELVDLARRFDSPGLSATAHHVVGLVEVADGAPERAVGPLRTACRTWRGLGARFESARARACLARTLRALGETDAAALEQAAADAVFSELGAAAEVIAADQETIPTTSPGVLTDREAQVLREVAQGHTNRRVGRELGISERTVERHVSNIFTKLAVSSRTEAARVAFERDLLSGR